MTIQEWRSATRQLRKLFPVSIPVNIRRFHSKRDFPAVTRFDGKVCLVRINSTQTDSEQVSSLLHEWAHIVVLDMFWSHGEIWGTTYAKIWDSWKVVDVT